MSTKTSPSSKLGSQPSQSLHGGRNAVIELNKIPRNSKGGVLVTDEEIQRAFQFFDADASGRINPKLLMNKLDKLNKKVTKKELKAIFGEKNHMSVQDIKEMLEENDVIFDPVEEAFQILDPNNVGFITDEGFRKIFNNLGYGCE